MKSLSIKSTKLFIFSITLVEHLIVERAKEMRGTLENASGDIAMLLSKLG
jgi:hypothetical protein